MNFTYEITKNEHTQTQTYKNSGNYWDVNE